MTRKEDLTGGENIYTNLDPFDHGTTSIRYLEVPKSVFDQIEDVLEKGWQLQGVTSVGQAYSQAEVGSNNFKALSDDGEYLLKLSHINSPFEQEVVNSLIGYSRGKGVPSPLVFPTSDGNLQFVANGRVFCLLQFIDGEHFDGSREELLEVAAAYAKFNEVLVNLPFEGLIRKSKEVSHHDWETLDEVARRFRSGRVVSGFDAQVAQFLDEIELESQKSRSISLKSLPMQVVHNDLHPHNLLFDRLSGHLLAFIDFDSLEYTQRIRGVAFTMHRLARTFGVATERQRDAGADLRNRAKAFIERYMEVGELTGEEVKMIAPVLKDEALRRISLILGDHYLKENRYGGAALRKQLQMLKEAAIFTDNF